MTAVELVTTLHRQGFTLIPLPEGKLAVTPANRLNDELRQRIRQCKTEVVALLTRPYINDRGELIISSITDRKYHWWNGGQSIAETLQELNASSEVWRRYVAGFTETIH